MKTTAALQELLDTRVTQLRELAPRSWALLESQPSLMQQAQQVLLGSDFVLRSLIQDDSLLESLVQTSALTAERTVGSCAALVDALHLGPQLGETDCARALRCLRRQEMVRLVWRDITGAASLQSTLRETSWFAEAIIAGATRCAAMLVAPNDGSPLPQDGGLVVLGMGKLGGCELNFSSDVDLVFLHASGGGTNGDGALSLEEFYTRQARILIRLLDAVTPDGFVFRVDMRLRPFGDSGPLVASFAFFEHYLQAHGREWERYAYVKARALTNAAGFAALSNELLRPFVYRRYLDFGVFESLREMKALISRDVLRRDKSDNLKLGAGGIREIEFIVQSFQLVRGGQESALRQPSLLTVLPRLAGAKLLPIDAVEELQRAYEFLRRLENRVQMLDDRQVHALPDEALARERIAVSMGYADVAALEQELAVHRGIVASHFAALFAEGVSPTPEGGELNLAALWEPGLDRAVLLEQLAQCCDDAPALLAQLDALCGSSRLRRLDETGRRRLKLLLELLLREQAAASSPDALRRVFSVLEAIGQRSVYFSLLVENRRAREQLVGACRAGDFLATQLARNPALLDELLDERWLHILPNRAALEAELVHRLSEVADDDVEREVEALCRFKQAAVFRVALADLAGRVPLMSVSDRLTEIAEIILQSALTLAWRQIVAQLGAPSCSDDVGGRRVARVAALGYGKLGGYELGYGSDLDLVFIHDSTGEQQETDRVPTVDNQVFFLRFGQRLIHLLSIHSNAGRLYEVDLRLRPSGKGGMMVTGINAFRQYQFESAWTWEHQALLHARTVAGDAELRERIEAVRRDVLQHAVRREDLRQQIAAMRERMRRELSAAQPGGFDLKQDRGGIADIEFLAQYWALRWAADYPPVVHFSDTIRQLESVASAALVPQETVDQLVAAYQHYRAVAHRRSLAGLSGVVEASACEPAREQVAAIWRATMTETV